MSKWKERRAKLLTGGNRLNTRAFEGVFHGDVFGDVVRNAHWQEEFWARGERIPFEGLRSGRDCDGVPYGCRLRFTRERESGVRGIAGSLHRLLCNAPKWCGDAPAIRRTKQTGNGHREAAIGR